MTEKGKRRWLIAMSGVGVLVLAGWIATHPKHHDPYDFLRDQRLLDVAVQGPGSFGPKEYRLYSWQKPWREVAKLAKADLPKYGLKPVKFKGDTSEGANWAAEIIEGGPCGVSSDTWISITPGRYYSVKQMMHETSNDAGWTTVVVTSALDESWVNVVRYSLFGLHWD